MLKKEYKNMILILMTIVYQTFIYLIAKVSPFTNHLLVSNLDLKIPFVSYFIYFYISWYIMLILVPYIMGKKDSDVLYKYVASMIIAITISGLIFIFYPTTITRPEIIGNTFSDIVISIIYAIDTPATNCLPSIHCLCCFLFILGITESKNVKWFSKTIIIIWSLLVIISTLFIKQHVLIDILASFILAILTYLFVNKSKIWKKIKIK